MLRPWATLSLIDEGSDSLPTRQYLANYSEYFF